MKLYCIVSHLSVGCPFMVHFTGDVDMANSGLEDATTLDEIDEAVTCILVLHCFVTLLILQMAMLTARLAGNLALYEHDVEKLLDTAGVKHAVSGLSQSSTSTEDDGATHPTSLSIIDMNVHSIDTKPGMKRSLPSE